MAVYTLGILDNSGRELCETYHDLGEAHKRGNVWLEFPNIVSVEIWDESLCLAVNKAADKLGWREP